MRPDSESLGSASPFNIVTKTFTLKNFTQEQLISLYKQHTDETGQIFEEGVINLVYEQSQGQPWLVNAIAREVTVEILQFDYTKPITIEMVDQAIQTIILRRDTHIDSLLERLKEERVQRVIKPIILGEDFTGRLSDDYLYVRDLGLIVEGKGYLGIANPIYTEVIARTLNYDAQQTLSCNSTYEMPRYFKDGQIDMDFLLRDFQQFWRENSAIWKERFDDYKEAAPHLVLMAFLQRVVNGGGQIIREMAASTGRLDICVVYEGRKYPIEIKIWRGEKSLQQGIEQTARYMDVYGCRQGWLTIFDPRPDIKWEDKIYLKKESSNGKTVTVVGL